MNVHGNCLCGECAWSAEVDPNRVFLCHCEDCQVQSGAAFRTTAVITSEAFELTRGELRVFEKTAESGAARDLAFCPTCGTHVYSAPGEGRPGMLSLRVGALAQRHDLKPVAQLWCRSRQAWLDGFAELPAIETQPGMPAVGD